MSTTTANPNVDVNGWCPECQEWAVRGRSNECMFCDSELVDSPTAPLADPEPRRGNRFKRAWTDEDVLAAARRWDEAIGTPPSRADWSPFALRRRITSLKNRLDGVVRKLALYESGDFPAEWTVRERFGSMNALNVQAFEDFEPRATGRQPLSSMPDRGPRHDLDAMWTRVAELRADPARKAEAKDAMYELAQALIYVADHLHTPPLEAAA